MWPGRENGKNQTGFRQKNTGRLLQWGSIMDGLSRKLTSGPLARQVVAFSLPLVASNLLQVLFNMSDLMVVGRFSGAEALGAVGSTTTLVALFTGFLIGMGSGVNVLVARYFGAGSRRSLRETIHTAVLVCLAVGLVMLAAGGLLGRFFLTVLNTKEELMEGAVLYLRIYFLGMPALALYNFGNAVFSAIGNTRRPLAYLSAAGVLNILLNLFFVIVCHLGVAGVAIASVLSQYLSAGLILSALMRSREDYRLELRRLRIYPAKCRMLLSLGLPAGLQNAIFQMANLFIQAGVNSFDAVVVEGNAAAANADAIVYDVMSAFYTACTSFMGQNLGAGQRQRVLRSYFVCLGYSFGAGLALGVGLVVLGPQFLGLFTTEAAVVQAGMHRLTIMGLSYAVSAFMDCTIAASRGLGRTMVPTVIVILGSCVFRILWVNTVFAWYGTITSLYLVFICSWVITSAAELVYFACCYRSETARPPRPARLAVGSV